MGFRSLIHSWIERPRQSASEADASLLVVGGTGLLADAIKDRLRASHDLVEARRGDDLDTMVANTKTIVVLEAVSAPRSLGPYETALQAVRNVVPRSKVATIVTVTYPPARTARRQKWLERAEKAEVPLCHLGVRFLTLRFDLAVGTPTHRAPADPYLFNPVMRGEGDQQCTPIRVDDLLDAVDAAIASGPQPTGVFEVGGERMSVRSLLTTLNPHDKKPKSIGRARWRWNERSLFLPDADLPAHAKPSGLARLGLSARPIARGWSPAAVEAVRPGEIRPTDASRYAQIGAAAWLVPYLALTGAVWLDIAIQDFFDGTGVEARVTAVLLALVGALGLVAGALLRNRQQHRYTVALVAAIATGIAGGALLEGSLAGPAAPFWVPLLALVIVAGSAASIVTLWTTVPHHLWPAGGNFRLATTIVSIGALAVGSIQFWYQNAYLPDRDEAAIDVTATLQPGPALASGGHVVEVSIDVKNAGDSQEYVLASHYEVIGLHSVSMADLGDGDATRPDAVSQGRDAPLGQAAGIIGSDVLRAGSFSDTGSFYEAHGASSIRLAVAVPQQYDAAMVRADIVMAKRGIGEVYLIPRSSQADGRFITQSYDLYQQSTWHRLTHGEYHMFTIEAVGDESSGYECGGYPQLQVYFARSLPSNGRAPSCDAQSRALQIAKFYGVSWNQATDELTLGR